MDVILLNDVARVGSQGAVVHVKPGYARNYLIPLGLATLATTQQLKAMEAVKQRGLQRAQRLRAESEALKRKVEGRSLTLKLSVGEDDQPFGLVTAHDLVEALAHEDLPIEKHMIGLEESIKTLGVYEIPIRLHAEVSAMLKVWVVKA